MNDNNKYPHTWEQAKQDAISGFIYGDAYGSWDEAAKLMAERYEQRIAELENALREIIEMADELGECEYIETEQFKKLLS